MNQNIGTNREAWLEAAALEMGDIIKSKGGRLNVFPYVIAPGMAHSGSRGGKVLGMCCYPTKEMSKAQVFISPGLGQPDAEKILDVVLHELVHVCTPGAKHGPIFKALATRCGLEGKMTATVAGPELKKTIALVAKKLGPYPQERLDPTSRTKQGTRMVKMECKKCGYVARTTKKWIEEIGPAHCPLHGAMVVEQPKTGGKNI